MKIEDINKAMKDACVYFCDITYISGIHDSNFFRLTRLELHGDKRIKILSIVVDL